MENRIAYCQKCGEEYENVMGKYGEKCTCGNDLDLATKVVNKDCSCIKLWGINITNNKEV